MATIVSISIPARNLKDYEYFKKISFARKDKSNSETWIKAMLEYNKHNPIGPSSQITDFVDNDPIVLPPISLYTDIKQFKKIINKYDTDKLVALRDKIKKIGNSLELELDERIDGGIDAYIRNKDMEKKIIKPEETEIQKLQQYPEKITIEPNTNVPNITNQDIPKHSLDEFFM